MVLGMLNSVFCQHVTTSFSASYNNKGGNDEEAYSDATGFGPRVTVHQIAPISNGRPTGNGILVEMNNVETKVLQPSWMMIVRGDLTYYHQGFVGSHELMTRIWEEHH